MHSDCSEFNCPQAIYGDGKVTKLDAVFFLLFLFMQQLTGLIFYDNQSNRFIPVTEKQMFSAPPSKKKENNKPRDPEEVGPEHMA